MRFLCFLFASLALAQTPPAAAPPEPATPAAAPTAGELMKAAMEKQRASVVAQQDAVRKQAKSAGATLIPWSPPTVQEGPRSRRPATQWLPRN